jgi:methylglutaconyl-CoA hydratase
LAEKLTAASAEATHQLKAVLWQGTEQWDKLLYERAAISGSLILTDFAKKAITK